MTCKYIKRCPDTLKLRESIRAGTPDENLADQQKELCEAGNGVCLTREAFRYQVGRSCSLRDALLVVTSQYNRPIGAR